MDGLVFGLNLHDLLVPGVSICEKILRPVIVYFVLITGLRIAGKRELAQLNTFDIVVLFSLTNAVQNAIIGNGNSLSGGIIGAVTLLVLNYGVIRFVYGNKKLRVLFEGEPDTLIANGKIRMDRLRREMITVDELVEAAHKQGIGSLSSVRRAVIDPDGMISFEQNDPDSAAIRHSELTREISELRGEIAALSKALEKKAKQKKR